MKLIHFVCLAVTAMATATAVSIFSDKREASQYLRRPKRANSGRGEEFFKRADQERECVEERCSHEEAREAIGEESGFEEWKSTTFRQCEMYPCNDRGSEKCENYYNSRVCYCKVGWAGDDCSESEEYGYVIG